MREGDGEPRSPEARRLDAELPAQPLERRVERIETRRGSEEASVPVELRPALLDPRKVEETGREIVSVRQLTAVDRLPGVRTIRQVFTETHVGRSHRVEHPARPLLDRSGDRHGASVVPKTDWPSRQRATIGS